MYRPTCSQRNITKSPSFVAVAFLSRTAHCRIIDAMTFLTWTARQPSNANRWWSVSCILTMFLNTHACLVVISGLSTVGLRSDTELIHRDGHISWGHSAADLTPCSQITRLTSLHPEHLKSAPYFENFLRHAAYTCKCGKSTVFNMYGICSEF